MSILSRALIIAGLALVTASATFADTAPSPPWGDLSEIEGSTRTVSHDGIFTPEPMEIGPDSTRFFTVAAPSREPAFAAFVAADRPTGDTYTRSRRGGACVFDGNAQYFVDVGGQLQFRIIARCGNLKRGYDLRICRLNAELRCAEAPWWYFLGRTYAVTSQGVVVNGEAPDPWDDAARAPDTITKLGAFIARDEQDRRAHRSDSNWTVTLNGVTTVYKADVRADPNATRRGINCREFQPDIKKYSIHVSMTGCLFRGTCAGDNTPDLKGVRDGDAIDWHSPAGDYVKSRLNIKDVSKWGCWLTTP